jgi:hypothetical protein
VVVYLPWQGGPDEQERPNARSGRRDHVPSEAWEAFIDMALPKKAHAQWRKYWFYVKETTLKGKVAIPQYSPEPSVTRRLNVRSLPREQEEVVKEMRIEIQALKDSGLTAVKLYNYWLTR